MPFNFARNSAANESYKLALFDAIGTVGLVGLNSSEHSDSLLVPVSLPNDDSNRLGDVSVRFGAIFGGDDRLDVTCDCSPNL